MQSQVEVLVQRLTPTLPLPQYAHPGDAGLDLYANQGLLLEPGQRATIGTGLAIALPPGYVALVQPRSGLADKHGVSIVNTPGTVDAGYRGEIRVTLINTDQAVPFRVEPGDRIAQLVIQPVSQAHLVEVDHLPGSGRGQAGFGSTGN